MKLTWTTIRVPLGTLKEWDKNPATISEKDAKQLARSLEKFDHVLPYVAAAPKNGHKELPLLDGHQRKMVELSLRKVDPKTLVDVRVPSRPLKDKERAELSVRLRRNVGQWDGDALLNWFESGDLLDWGFEQKELESFGFEFGDEGSDAEPQIDRAAELLKKWKVKTGDLWQIGEHRLICGDCTDAAVVARVMDGERADMTFIDIPYGVDYEGGRNPESNVPREKLEGDANGDLYMPILKMCKASSKKRAPMYVWFAASVGKPVYDAVEAIGYEVRAMIIWNKLDAHYGNFMAQYMQKHEPCLYIVDGKSNWKGASNEVTVWDVKQPTVNEFHPTQKPVELPMRAIGNHEAEVVIDFCVGSGTTLVACENLRRRCRAVEISEAYCAVALERMATAFEGIEIKRLK